MGMQMRTGRVSSRQPLFRVNVNGFERRQSFDSNKKSEDNCNKRVIRGERTHTRPDEYSNRKLPFESVLYSGGTCDAPISLFI